MRVSVAFSVMAVNIGTSRVVAFLSLVFSRVKYVLHP